MYKYFLVLLFVPALSNADVYKCTINGRVNYGESCGGSSSASVVRNNDTNGVSPARRDMNEYIRKSNEAFERLKARREEEYNQRMGIVPAQRTVQQNVSPAPSAPKNCDRQEQELLNIQSSMRFGYPAEHSNYWHDRLRAAQRAVMDCKS